MAEQLIMRFNAALNSIPLNWTSMILLAVYYIDFFLSWWAVTVNSNLIETMPLVNRFGWVDALTVTIIFFSLILSPIQFYAKTLKKKSWAFTVNIFLIFCTLLFSYSLLHDILLLWGIG